MSGEFEMLAINDRQVSAKDAKKLAVAYCAFIEAANAQQLPDAKVWARILADMQLTTGISLISLATIHDYAPGYDPQRGF
jgi:hypothetical protein